MRSNRRQASGRRDFPHFSADFTTVDGRLVPLQREVLGGADRDGWRIILSPGRVWSEPDDEGMSRASFPFTLVTDRWNEAHNGVATFLYDARSVSSIHFQVTQETAPWSRIDFWGETTASYVPVAFPMIDALREEFRKELAGRVAVKEWPELQNIAGPTALRDFDRGLDDVDISGAAVLIDDVLYYRPAATRHGAYPYPLEMRHGVFSVTKSLAAALTMLRLAEKYGERVFDLYVTDYVDVSAASHGGWHGITFGHVLNMTAGIGDNAPDPDAGVTFADENDEESDTWSRIWRVSSRERKLREALAYGDYPWGPGQVVRYNSAHTFILGAAMDSFYRSMAGPGAGVWQMMKDEVYRPIGVEHVPVIQTVGEDPLPIYAFGLFLNAYDTARLVQLLTNDGAWNGRQLLHRERTRESLYRDGQSGAPTYVRVRIEADTRETARYLNSFWSIVVRGSGDCAVRVPFMWGFGGNFVVIMPNGVAAFRYADAHVDDPAALALTAHRIRPAC